MAGRSHSQGSPLFAAAERAIVEKSPGNYNVSIVKLIHRRVCQRIATL